MRRKKNGMKEFGDWLRFIMEEQGTYRYKLAEAIGVDKRTITRYLSNDTLPTVEVLNKILDYYGYHIVFKKNGK